MLDCRCTRTRGALCQTAWLCGWLREAVSLLKLAVPIVRVSMSVSTHIKRSTSVDKGDDPGTSATPTVGVSAVCGPHHRQSSGAGCCRYVQTCKYTIAATVLMLSSLIYPAQLLDIL